MSATCPWCSAPRDAGPSCPQCGANYAKAEAIRAHGKAPVAAAAVPAVAVASASLQASALSPLDAGASPEPVLWQAEEEDLTGIDDPEYEWKLRVWAIPCALLAAMLWHAGGLGHALQRIFLTMPVHELGHAVSGWLTGFAAIPTVWKTHIPDSRGPIFPLVMLALIGYGMYRAHLANRRDLMMALGCLVLVQAIGTLLLSEKTAHVLIIFGGDGMGMVLATLLMGTFYFGRDTQLYKGSLRWGFLVIGAAAFVDIYSTWWAARSDIDAVPFGLTGDMTTDASKLVDDFGWKIDTMIRRYVGLGIVCLLALAALYAWGLREAARARQAAGLAQ